MTSKADGDDDRQDDSCNRDVIGHRVCHFESREDGIATIEVHALVLFGSNKNRDVRTNAVKHVLSKMPVESGEIRRGWGRACNALKQKDSDADVPNCCGHHIYRICPPAV